ncbi:RNA-binding protein 48 [Lucilia sericata]|uniref:RNA-binding protein 48 n=1 Tax=Lucilia sericata TaxID=13632 RepID=UPI0018A8752E|nr:RNA-binding protein 48 [Lucilia sericata]
MDCNAEHHKQYDYCTTRLKYRQGRQLKAVKVYTVANESQNLLIFGVPKINLLQELKQRLQRFGKLYYVRNVTTEMLDRQLELEQFTEVYLAKFYKIHEARKCKRFMDAKEFYGGILHISYAPEYETKEEFKDKLQKRKLEIERSLKRINLDNNNEKRLKKTDDVQ